MKWFLPVNQPFKNLKEFASVHAESLPLNPHSSHSKVELKSTQDGPAPEDGSAQFRRFQKNGPKKWQISFQKYFLAQHTTTFRRQLWNFLEYGLPQHNPQNSKLTPAFRPDNLPTGQPLTITTLLAKEGIPASAVHVHQFCQSISQLEDLENFLNAVLQECSQGMARELIAICLQLWIQFGSEVLKFQESKELLKKAKEWVALKAVQIFQRNDFTYLNLKVADCENEGRQAEILKLLTRFLGYFATTVLFILAGFFQNPYTDVSFDLESEAMTNYPKRQLSISAEGFWSNESDFSDSDQSFQPKKHFKPS